MLELYIDASELEGLRDYLEEFERILEEELRKAFRRIGARVNRTAKEILSKEVYSVEIPFRKRLRGELAQKARRQVGGSKSISEADLLARVKGKFGGTSSGQPFRRWEREGDLIGKESWETLADEIGIMLVNSSGHARARNALGGPPDINPAGRRSGQQSGLSPTREVHWQQQAVEQEREWIAQELQAAVRRALERRP